MALLDAEVGLGEAVQAGAVSVRGSLDDVQRAHDALRAYVHAAVRASTQPALLSELRAGA
ncbi:SCP-2 sterol transfer family protein [Mycobacterium avium subsp. paratuberculosis 10-8425]|nr:SCP-2 sterol transfer family protein [Mycobacterium avium subsp. paratuberculosis 10-8425]